MIKLPFWPPIHKLLVTNQKIIYKLFFVAYILVGSLIPLGYYLFSSNLDLFLLIAGVAGKFGTIALILFLGTLIPGILQRFKIFPLVGASIVLFRRQMGILMFLIGILHSSYISTIPAVMTGNVGLEYLPKNGLMGIITLLFLLPVWLTSNDFSQRKFGKYWKTLQRLTYFALIAIFLHVALVELSAAILTITVLLFELTSWLKVWFQKSSINTEK
jgi:DMSO/TMAO reductase YedYZ heme-binding membrane subunit